MVVKKLYENGIEIEPQIAVIDNLTSQDATVPLSAKQGNVLNVNKLAKLPNTESGTPYAFFYEVNTILADNDSLLIPFNRLVINDGVTKREQTITIPQADILNNKAGLYTKALADLKLDLLPKKEGDTDYDFIYSIDNIVVGSADISIPYRSLQINDGTSKSIGTILLPTANIDNGKCGLYSASLAAKKMNILPTTTEGHQYSFPYAVKQVIQSTNDVKATFDTLILNDGVTKGELTLTIPSAVIDAENNKAGLYSKTEAEKKVDVNRGAEFKDTLLVADANGRIISSNIIGSSDTKIYYKSVAVNNEIATKADIPTFTYDTEMSDTSTNAVQNRVIKNYVDGSFDGVIRETDVINKLDSTATQKPLSANMGRELNVKKADKTEIPTITFNGSVTKTPSFYAPTTIGAQGMLPFSNGTEIIWRYLGDVFDWKGVCTYAELLEKPKTIGHIWTVSDRDYTNYICDGTTWIDIGKFVDLSGYQTKQVGTPNRLLISDAAGKIAVSTLHPDVLDKITTLRTDAQDQIDTKLTSLVTEGEGITSLIDNSVTAHGCKMRVDFGSTVGAVALYNDNGDNGIIGQILAINPTTRVGARLNITKEMICYGTGKYLVADSDHEIAVKGEVVMKNTAITAGTKCRITYDAKGLVTGGEDIDATDVKKMTGYAKATAKADISTADTLNVALGKVEYRVGSSEGKITTLEEKITTLEGTVSSLNTRLQTLENANLVRYE